MRENISGRGCIAWPFIASARMAAELRSANLGYVFWVDSGERQLPTRGTFPNQISWLGMAESWLSEGHVGSEDGCPCTCARSTVYEELGLVWTEATGVITAVRFPDENP